VSIYKIHLIPTPIKYVVSVLCSPFSCVVREVDSQPTTAGVQQMERDRNQTMINEKKPVSEDSSLWNTFLFLISFKNTK